jgi:E3 ubiquitin-protein ligase MYCBP2
MVSRFKTVCNGWGYGGSIDAICFSASRSVRVIGFGVYLSQKDLLESTCRLFRGDAHSKEEYNLTKDLTIKPEDTNYNPKIYQVLFEKPLDLPMGEKMSCILLIKNNTSQYGSGGMTTAEGEDGTVFTFSQCKASSNGTSNTSGQIPEVFYI